MKQIYYNETINLTFHIPNTDYAVSVDYQNKLKDDKKGYEISLWLEDISRHSPLYKKYICGDFLKNDYKTIKKAIKITISQMIKNNIFDLYIKDFEKEIDCIGNMYAAKDNIKGE